MVTTKSRLLFLYYLVLAVSFIASVHYAIRKSHLNKFINDRRFFSDYPFTVSFPFEGKSVNVSWEVNWIGKSVEFLVSFPSVHSETINNILVGFSDHGFLPNTDFCLFRIKTSELLDGWIDESLGLMRDIHADCDLIGSGDGFFRFSRKFVTCDPRDYAIEPGTTNLLLAVSHGEIRSLHDPKVFHEMRYTQLLQHKFDHSRLAGRGHERNLKYLDILTGNVTVPAQLTTYWCSIVELGPGLQQKKHHAIKYEAIITKGNEHLVHHFEVFHCQVPTRQFRGDCSADKPVEAKSCSKVVAAWAMGANPVVYPIEAGMPLGGQGFVPFLMVEVHYNNVGSIAGIKDNSGIRITYTDQLRRHDAGIIELGLIYSDTNSIPPGQTAFPMTGYCVADCTDKFPRDGIRIFASQLHAHLTGRKLHTSHWRQGKKIGEINRDNHFSPHWQHIQSLRKHVQVLPGDVLATTCVYETKRRTNWTWGGYGIEDEMCVNYIHYYPATVVEVCKSAVSNSSLHTFFSKLGVSNKKQLKIHEKFLAVHWTPAKMNVLREFYHVSPLNVACLDPSGQLFPGHPSNWSRVPRPNFVNGIYEENTRATDECFATND